MGVSDIAKLVLDKLNKLTTWQVVIIIAAVGFAVFFNGLTNPFMGDDNSQITVNPVIHSLSNISLFFEGSTFYNGKGIAPLSGNYYRPLMTTAYSLLYTLFGPQQLAFHLLSLLLCIASACLLYLFFRHTFNPVLSLILSLIFLTHPINSEIVYAIPAMQDALYFFFGMLGLLILVHFRSTASMILVALCLFLSLLSKETGALFVAMSLLYLFWFDRRRLMSFMGIMALPAIVYLSLKLNAVGLNSNPRNAPIDFLSLAGRLLTVPSILLLYVVRLVFPVQLASAYYWVYPNVSLMHTAVPLLVDLVVIGAFVYLGLVVHKRLPESKCYTYLFFGAWASLGLLIHMQLTPLDMTVSETWMYFPLVGVLGMVGMLFMAIQIPIKPEWLVIASVVILCLFGIRTWLRASDWSGPSTLAMSDIAASPDDFAAYDDLARDLIGQHDYQGAKYYAQQSVDSFPSFDNNNSLGFALVNLKDYPNALKAYESGLKYGDFYLLYDNMGALALVYGTPESDKAFLLSAVQKFPHDYFLWMYLAIFEDRNSDNSDAQDAIRNAASYGNVPAVIYNGIINRQPYSFTIGN